MADNKLRQKKSHLWKVDPKEHYCEPFWCSERLFEEENFKGEIYDPCCGFGRIVTSARKAGLKAFGSDIMRRGIFKHTLQDFRTASTPVANIVCNPPFSLGREFVMQALKLAKKKVAVIIPVRRLNAASWLEQTPLQTIWLMTPRPSMPPGDYITKGKKAGGGTVDFAWLVFSSGFEGEATVKWLHRDHNRKRGGEISMAKEMTRGEKAAATRKRNAKAAKAAATRAKNAAAAKKSAKKTASL